MCQWIVLYAHYFNFPFSLIFIRFTNQKTLNQSLVQKLNLIFKFSLMKRQINIPHWTFVWYKGWGKDEKTSISCSPIALKFWDEFNASFVLLYFSSYRSIKIVILEILRSSILLFLTLILLLSCLGSEL